MDANHLYSGSAKCAMDSRKAIFAGTLAFSILLELWVRYGLLYLTGHDGFYIWPNVDNVMHFFWGLNFFMVFMLFLRWTPAESVLGVYGWQMLWELVEMVGDIVLTQPVHMLDHFFLDGIKDTVVDVAGALLGWLLLLPTKEGHSGTERHPLIRRAITIHLYLMLALVPIGSFWLVATGKSADLLAIMWIVLAVPLTYAIMRLLARDAGQTKRARA